MASKNAWFFISQWLLSTCHKPPVLSKLTLGGLAGDLAAPVHLGPKFEEERGIRKQSNHSHDSLSHFPNDSSIVFSQHAAVPHDRARFNLAKLFSYLKMFSGLESAIECPIEQFFGTAVRCLVDRRLD